MRIHFIVLSLLFSLSAAAQFQLSSRGYFRNQGVDVMAFDDIYPEGHQGGVSVIMHGNRILTNGDIRLEATPGQWQPLPKQLKRTAADNRIVTNLCYPDSSRHYVGFNPAFYPELQLNYQVRVEPKGEGILVTVDLDRPVPQQFLGKVGFNLEIFPGAVMGKPWIMDQASGIYPTQPNSPVIELPSNTKYISSYRPEGKPLADFSRLNPEGYSPMIADDIIGAPYAVGTTFTSNPDNPYERFTIQSLTGDLQLYDGRMNHNNGWFVLRSEIADGATKNAIQWLITPNVVKGWIRQPVVQTSQVGYLPQQTKQAVIELDSADTNLSSVSLYRITAHGKELVKQLSSKSWGNFLRYHYLVADFSDVSTPGLYQVTYGKSESPVFRIGSDVFDRGIWQPVVEYFLPVQMCHMRVSEKYRVWHGLCHMDDARMAEAGDHIDGYSQEPDLSPYSPLANVPDVNVGGWHDAGDFDLRVESQAGESYILSMAYQQFHPEIDVTTIDQKKHITEIHQPDGKNDILQQIENGALTVVASYKALGRLYRGIICPTARQYVLLGDAASMTDNERGNADDRWIFTENNPMRELSTAGQLAAISATLRGFNDPLADECLQIARKIYDTTNPGKMEFIKIQAAVELYLATNEKPYLDYILKNQQSIAKGIGMNGWVMARLQQHLVSQKNSKAKAFTKMLREAFKGYAAQLDEQIKQTPYGVPYRPYIWGAGWDIQSFAFRHYFLAKAFPDIFSMKPVSQALSFVLGCHPGSNQASFASGVGAESATTAYGANRADWSYIPGGVVSGTALIRPDFPELLKFPFLWQQTEYCLGGASSNYMFIALAMQNMK